MEHKTWLDAFEAREQKEIDLARLYAEQYDHGSPGHLHLKIIAKLATILDRHEGIEVRFAIERTLSEISGASAQYAETHKGAMPLGLL